MAMTKQEWQNFHDKVDTLHREFLLDFPRAENGRNAQIRKEAQKNVDRTIQTTIGYIRNNVETYTLFTGGSTDGQHRAEMFQELSLSRYFDYDISEYLKKVKKKIESLKED